MQTYWGVDLGGTKIEGVILAAPSPDAVIIRQRIDTEAQYGYEHIVRQISKLIDLLKAETGLQPDKIGFCTPGTLDPGTGTMKNSNMVCINGRPFQDDLTRALGVPVTTTNDANCFALSEATMGIVQDVIPDFRMVFGVILGTGVGGVSFFGASMADRLFRGDVRELAVSGGITSWKKTATPATAGSVAATNK